MHWCAAMAAYAPPTVRRVVVTEAVWPGKPDIFTIWPLWKRLLTSHAEQRQPLGCDRPGFGSWFHLGQVVGPQTSYLTFQNPRTLTHETERTVNSQSCCKEIMYIKHFRTLHLVRSWWMLAIIIYMPNKIFQNVFLPPQHETLLWLFMILHELHFLSWWTHDNIRSGTVRMHYDKVYQKLHPLQCLAHVLF